MAHPARRSQLSPLAAAGGRRAAHHARPDHEGAARALLDARPARGPRLSARARASAVDGARQLPATLARQHRRHPRAAAAARPASPGARLECANAALVCKRVAAPLERERLLEAASVRERLQLGVVCLGEMRRRLVASRLIHTAVHWRQSLMRLLAHVVSLYASVVYTFLLLLGSEHVPLYR